MLCCDKVNTFLTTFCFQSITNINIYYNYKQCCFWSGIALFSEGSMNRSKVAIIGAGNVGSTTAFCMINQGICDEIVLIDINHEKAYGEVLDLQHSMEYMGRNCKVSAGDYSQCRDADIIVITASAPMSKDLNDRRVLLGATKKILKSIVHDIMKSGFSGIILVVSNPVDIMTNYVWKESGLPSSHVIGSGTTLDTARLRFNIGKKVDIDPRSVDAYVIGEHGDSEIIAWSSATIGGKDIYSVVKDNSDRIGADPYDDLLAETIQGGWEVFSRKGSTTYGIAASVTSIVKSILFDENRIYPLSVNLNGHYGEDNIYVSVPTIINRNGAKEIVEINLTEDERMKFHESCEILRSISSDL